MNERLRNMICDLAKRQVPVQTRWVEVVSVDKVANTMTAKSLETGMEYYKILLGLGAELRYPKKGSRALIGIVENNAAASYMIWAKELVEINLLAELTKLNGNSHGGLLIAQKLFDELDKEKARTDGIINALNNAAPTATGDGGTSLIGVIKSSLASIVHKGKFDDNLVNDTVKHGS